MSILVVSHLDVPGDNSILKEMPEGSFEKNSWHDEGVLTYGIPPGNVKIDDTEKYNKDAVLLVIPYEGADGLRALISKRATEIEEFYNNVGLPRPPIVVVIDWFDFEPKEKIKEDIKNNNKSVAEVVFLHAIGTNHRILNESSVNTAINTAKKVGKTKVVAEKVSDQPEHQEQHEQQQHPKPQTQESPAKPGYQPVVVGEEKFEHNHRYLTNSKNEYFEYHRTYYKNLSELPLNLNRPDSFIFDRSLKHLTNEAHKQLLKKLYHYIETRDKTFMRQQASRSIPVLFGSTDIPDGTKTPHWQIFMGRNRDTHRQINRDIAGKLMDALYKENATMEDVLKAGGIQLGERKGSRNYVAKLADGSKHYINGELNNIIRDIVNQLGPEEKTRLKTEAKNAFKKK